MPDYRIANVTNHARLPDDERSDSFPRGTKSATHAPAPEIADTGLSTKQYDVEFKRRLPSRSQRAAHERRRANRDVMAEPTDEPSAKRQRVSTQPSPEQSRDKTLARLYQLFEPQPSSRQAAPVRDEDSSSKHETARGRRGAIAADSGVQQDGGTKRARLDIAPSKAGSAFDSSTMRLRKSARQQEPSPGISGRREPIHARRVALERVAPTQLSQDRSTASSREDRNEWIAAWEARRPGFDPDFGLIRTFAFGLYGQRQAALQGRDAERILRKGVIPFTNDLHDFGVYTRFLSIALANPRILERNRETIRRVEDLLEQTSAAFAALYPERLTDASGYEVESLASLCSQWTGRGRRDRAGILTIAARIAELGRATGPWLLNRTKAFERDTALIINGLSKWPEERVCRDAVVNIAKALLSGSGDPARFPPVPLSNLVNGLSKWPREPECEAVVCAIAEGLATRQRELADPRTFGAQALSNLINGMSKWPVRSECEKGARAIAEAIVARDRAGSGRLRELADPHKFAPLALSNLVNGFSKFSTQPAYAEAVSAIAHALIERRRDLVEPRHYPLRHLSTLINGLSKFPEKVCKDAANEIAEALVARKSELAKPEELKPHELSTMINGVSKWPEEAACKAAAVALAAALLARESELADPGKFDPQALSNAVNGLSKWPREPACREAICAIANALVVRSQALTLAGLPLELNDTERFKPRHLASLVNGMGKLPTGQGCQEAVCLIAGAIVARRGELADPEQFEPRHLSNVVNGVSKWSAAPACQAAMRAIVEALRLRKAELEYPGEFEAQHFAMLINGFSRCATDPVLADGLNLLAARLGQDGYPYRVFEMGQLAVLANALFRFASVADEEDDDWQLAHARLQELAGHLDTCRDRLPQADARQIGMISKALAMPSLYEELALVARQTIPRLTACLNSTALSESSLETLGNVCIGLLPIARSSELSKHRRKALALLDKLQPVIARKLDLLLAPPVRARHDAHDDAPPEQYETRRPALTIFQVLKTYNAVQGLWKRRHVQEGRLHEIAARRTGLKEWLATTLERTREIVQADLQQMSWNLIALIDAGDDALDTLDRFMLENLPQISAAHPPTRFDAAAVLRDMSHEPRPVGPELGASTLTVVDMLGADAALGESAASQASARPYSFLARVTSGAVPLVEVELPARLTVFMLGRTFTRGGEPWRFDMFGGSHLQKPSRRAADFLARVGEKNRYGRLPAVRYADTAPGSDLMRLVRKLAPQREDWYRMQRSLLETVPHDHVIEGRLRLALFADRPDGVAHPFAIRGPGGPIALCPNDGCGFIKASVARTIPAIARAWDAFQAVKTNRASDLQQQLAQPYGRTTAPIPAQALQHLPSDPDAVDEVRSRLRAKLAVQTSQTHEAVDKPTLFGYLVHAGVTGAMGVAVPSADDRVHLASAKSADFDRFRGDVLIGKAPYDKPNLLCVEEARIGTAAQGDATAQFLDEAFAFQYSYTAWDESSATASRNDKEEGPDMLHGKGVTIVIPDDMWDDRYADTDWAWSTEDMKTHSSWTDQRHRDRLPERMSTLGSLRVKQIFPPGSMIAMPIRELRKRDADCDGDLVFVYAGYPALAALVSRFTEDRARRRVAPSSFKPKKSATAAIDPNTGNYQAGRAGHILSALHGQELIGVFSTTQTMILAQPEPLRREIAEQAMFGTYEGVARELKEELRLLLDDEQSATTEEAGARLRQLSEQGLAHAHSREARQAASVLRDLVNAWFDERAERAASDGAKQLAQALPPELAQRLPAMARAYEAASSTRDRIQALLDFYPVCRLPRSEFPDGQPGYVPGDALSTLYNLLTIGIKVGTDAPKSETATSVFRKIGVRLQGVMMRQPERLRTVPYTKTIAARLLGLDRFDPDRAWEALEPNPTLAARFMEVGIEESQRAGLVPPFRTQRERVAASVPEEAIRAAAEELAIHARRMEAETSALVQRVAHANAGTLAGWEHRVKSKGSIQEKLEQRLTTYNGNLERARTSVNDALRYSIIFDDDEFTGRYWKTMSEFERLGATKTKVANSFDRTDIPFSSVRTALRTQSGATFEVQFHTPETFKLKTRFHDLYKQSGNRAMDGATRAQIKQALAPAYEAFNALPLPVGVADIGDFSQRLMSAPASAKRRRSAAQQPVQAQVHSLHKLMNERASQLEPTVTETLSGICAKTSAILVETAPGRQALGLSEVKNKYHPLKSASSLREKINRTAKLKGISKEAAASTIRDTLRYTVVTDERDFVDGYKDIMRGLQRAGMKELLTKNTFADDETYKAINVSLSFQNQAFEVQFHTRESFQAKRDSHLYYKMHQRESAKTTPDPQKLAQYDARMKKIWETVKPPRDLDSIEDLTDGVDSRKNSASRKAPTDRSTNRPGTRLSLSGLPDLHIGEASGAGLNCLLDSIFQLHRNSRGSSAEGRRWAGEMRRTLNVLDQIPDEGMIDIYAGAGMQFANDLGIRIQVIERTGEGNVIHPIIGQTGQLVRLLHSGDHFQPLWEN